jgi:hypothetical protein
LRKPKEQTYAETWTVRTQKLNDAGFSSYGDFLNSDFWDTVKQKQKEDDRPHLRECYLCSSTDVELHHRTYKKLTEKDALRDIRAYCRTHHQMIHDLAKLKQIPVIRATKLVCRWWKTHNIFAFQRRLILASPNSDWSKILKGRPVHAVQVAGQSHAHLT